MDDVGAPSVASMEVSAAGPGGLTVKVSGELDYSSAPSLESEVDRILGLTASSIVFDLGDLRFMDSSGIAILLRIVDVFGPATVVHPTSIIRRVVENLGLETLLRLAEGGR